MVKTGCLPSEIRKKARISALTTPIQHCNCRSCQTQKGKIEKTYMMEKEENCLRSQHSFLHGKIIIYKKLLELKIRQVP